MSAYVIPRVEREGLFCPCGELEPMVVEVGFWLDDGIGISLVTDALPTISEERLLWHRCVLCGSISRETLLPA